MCHGHSYVLSSRVQPVDSSVGFRGANKENDPISGQLKSSRRSPTPPQPPVPGKGWGVTWGLGHLKSCTVSLLKAESVLQSHRSPDPTSV